MNEERYDIQDPAHWVSPVDRPEQDPHILDYLLLVTRRKWTVLLIILVSGAIALGATYIVPYSFESEAMLLPPDRLSSSGLLSSLNAGGALKILKEVENPSVDLIQDLLESYSLADRLSHDSIIHRYFVKAGETHQQLVASIQESLLTIPGFSKVNVRGTITTGWFSTPAEKENARNLAPYLANLACRTMDTMIGEVLRADAKQAQAYANSDYTNRSNELDSLDGVKERFEQEHGIPALETQTLETIKEVGKLEADEDEARIHLDMLDKDFSADDARVMAARAELDEARAARARYQETSAIGPGLDTLPEVSRGYAEILRKEATLEPIVTFLREEKDQQEIFAERVRSVITIVDTAKIPDTRVSPKRAPMLALGLTGGGFFSVLFVSLMAFLASLREFNGKAKHNPNQRSKSSASLTQ